MVPIFNTGPAENTRDRIDEAPFKELVLSGYSVMDNKPGYEGVSFNSMREPHSCMQVHKRPTWSDKFWFYFLNLVLTPTKHVFTMRVDKVILLYAILKGYKISLRLSSFTLF